MQVIRPSDRILRQLIHRTIEFVVREGPAFEALVMARTSTDPKYRFLFDNTSAEHVYYRWKLFSVLQVPHKTIEERIRLQLEVF